MPLDSIKGPSTPTKPLKPTAAPAETGTGPAPRPRGAASETDRLRLASSGARSEISLSEVANSARARQPFDVSEASEKLIASHQGDLDQAYFESLDLRNTTKQDGYAAKLAAYSEKLGYQRNLTPDELRDVEHFMFAAASVADKAQPVPNGDMLDRAGTVLKREPHALALGILTVGYTAAKAVNRFLPKDLKFLKSRTDPSLDEVTSGLKGTLRGLRDKV